MGIHFMPTTTTVNHRAPRPRVPAGDVMTEVNAKLPHLIPYMYLDREWIWYCGPSLAGGDNKPTREILKDIGFRFAPNGHVMQDGKTTGSWSHSCQKPLPRWHKGKANGVEAPADQPAEPVQPSIVEPNWAALFS